MGISSFLPSQSKLHTTTTNLPHTSHHNKMKTLLVIAVTVVAAIVVEAAPAPAPGHHGHRNKHPEEHVCTEVDIQEIFEDGELIDIIEKIIPVACPERHRPSHHSHHYHHDEDSSEEDSDEDK